MTIAKTLREIAEWPEIYHAISVEDENHAGDFYDELYPDFNGAGNDRTRKLLLLMAAEVAEDEGL